MSNEERDEVNTDDTELDIQVHMNIVSTMTVDYFQNQLEKHKIPNWEIDHMVYDLAKAIAESEDARKTWRYKT